MAELTGLQVCEELARIVIVTKQEKARMKNERISKRFTYDDIDWKA